MRLLEFHEKAHQIAEGIWYGFALDRLERVCYMIDQGAKLLLRLAQKDLHPFVDLLELGD